MTRLRTIGGLSPLNAALLTAAFVVLSGVSGSAQADGAEQKPDGDYLANWLVAGPLTLDVPVDALLHPDGGVEAKFREGDLAPQSERRWTRYEGEGNLVNLRWVTGYGLEGMRALAFTSFESDAEQSGRIHCVSQNDFKLWLNGSLVLEKPEEAYGPLKWMDRDVALRRGANLCYIVCSTYGAAASVYAAPLFGFAVRVDGPRETPPQPMVWDPIVPSVPTVEDGRYALLSPDWRYMEGDDPAWAQPDFDHSNWKKIPDWRGLGYCQVYWMRIRAHFSPRTALARYFFWAPSNEALDVYIDGVRVHGRDRREDLLDLFHYRDTTLCPPSECTLAVRVTSGGPSWPIQPIFLRPAEKAMSEQLGVLQPRKHHRLFLVFCLFFTLLYYLLVYRNHPRQLEGAVCCFVILLAVASMLLVTTDSWTFHHALPTAGWHSAISAGITYIAGIAMVHVMAYGAVSWRAVFGYAGISAVLFAVGWKLDTRWIAFSIFPLMTLEYVRVWVMYDLIPRRPNRAYVGIGLLFLIAGEIITGLYGPTNGFYFSNIGPYAHLYGLVALAACLVMYASREAALGLHELRSLNVTLEDKVRERTQQVAQLTHRLISAEEAERERIARELHDSVAQTLWYARLSADGGSPDAPEARPAGEMRQLLDKAIAEVKNIAYGLRPPELDKLGFNEALSQACKDFTQKSGIPLDYYANAVDNTYLSPAAEVNLYRVLQEALHNILQHAGASSVRVRLVGAYPSVILRVEDNGRGFDLARQSEQTGADGMGLRSMEERIRLIGGTMSIRSAPGEGVRIVIEVPQGKESDGCSSQS